MLGQTKFKQWLSKATSVPHYFIIVGNKGSGKKTLCHYLASALDCVYAPVECKVEAVREVIRTASTSTTNVLYVFEDADNMKAEAKNALLKITEEAPANARFALTVSSDASLLDTMKSRAYIYYMTPYTRDELDEYCNERGIVLTNEMKAVASTPFECDLLGTTYKQPFMDYVNLVVDNIAEVASCNAFKSASKLALKSDEGYSLELFFEAFIAVCESRVKSDYNRYASGVLITTNALYESCKLGANLKQVYDEWVFKIRSAWL